eukprot:576332-Pyramimonas_sp.AAC.1
MTVAHVSFPRRHSSENSVGPATWCTAGTDVQVSSDRVKITTNPPPPPSDPKGGAGYHNGRSTP